MFLESKIEMSFSEFVKKNVSLFCRLCSHGWIPSASGRHQPVLRAWHLPMVGRGRAESAGDALQVGVAGVGVPQKMVSEAGRWMEGRLEGGHKVKVTLLSVDKEAGLVQGVVHTRRWMMWRRNLGEEMVGQGLGVVEEGEGGLGWHQERLRRAEERARVAGRGVWRNEEKRKGWREWVSRLWKK